jgi:hypothetical protein
MAGLQPVPNYAMPFIGNEEALRQLGLKFNPVWLKWFIDTLGQITGGTVIDHNTLAGIQGGTTNEYYHLTSARHSTLTGVQSANIVLAGPTSGAAAIAAFRALVTADFPDLIVAGGPIGSATVAPIVTWDAKGRLTVVGSATITPAVGSITGLGTGVATALAVNTGSAGAFVLLNGALGTPSSGTLTNATGLPIGSGVSGLAAGVATFLGTPSSANLAAAVTDETGGGLLVFGTTPTLNQPNVVGTTTNDDAAAGSVGEYVSATLAAGSATSLTTTTAKTVTSISLTAGDWDVDGAVNFLLGGTTNVVALYGGISTTNNTLGANNTFTGVTNAAAGIVYSPTYQVRTAPPIQRISLAATTTVYLIAYADFTVSTATAHGLIQARRVR